MKNITINTLDLREQIALSLSAFLDTDKYSIPDIAIKMANEIELMSINREGK